MTVWAAESETPPAMAAPAHASTATAAAQKPAETLTTTTEGSLTGVDLLSATPSVTVSTPDGRSVTLGIDPNTTTVRQQGQAGGTLRSLKTGQRVQVTHQRTGDKDLAQVITIRSIAPMATSSETPRKSY